MLINKRCSDGYKPASKENQLYVDFIAQQRSSKSIKKIEITIITTVWAECLKVYRKNSLDYSRTIKTDIISVPEEQGTEYLLIKLLPLRGAGTKTGVVLCGLSNNCNDSIHS